MKWKAFFIIFKGLSLKKIKRILFARWERFYSFCTIWFVLCLKKSLNCKILLKVKVWIINQSRKIFIILVNIHYLLLFKGYTWRIFIIRKCWSLAKQFCHWIKEFWKRQENTLIFFKKNNTKYLGLFFSARKKVLNSFKSRLFPIKYLDKTPTCEPTPEPRKEPEVAK